MTKSIALVILTLGLAACGANPTAPTPPSDLHKAAVAARAWPVQHPSGDYGREDPDYPPTGAQCPSWRDLWPAYNGWNWVCYRYADNYRILPRFGGYDLLWVEER